MRKQIIITILLCLLIAVFLGFCQQAWAQTRIEGLGNPGALTQLSDEAGVQKTIGRFIYYILGVVGALALLAFVYGGFIWITSTGNTDKITSGKKVMVWTGLGMIIILFSFVITDFMIFALTFNNTTVVIAPPPTVPCTGKCLSVCDAAYSVPEPTGDANCKASNPSLPSCCQPTPPPPPPPPSPECGRKQLSGGGALEKKILDMGASKGSVYLVRDFLTIPDKIKISCANDPSKVIVDTGPLQCIDAQKIDYDCGSDGNLLVEIESADPANTKWCFGLICDTSKVPTETDIRNVCPLQETFACPNLCLPYPGHPIDYNICCQPSKCTTVRGLKSVCYCNHMGIIGCNTSIYQDTIPPVSTWTCQP